MAKEKEMDIKQIEKLMMAMRRFGTKKLVIKREGVEIELEREVEVNPELLQAALMQQRIHPQPHHLPRSEAPLHTPHEEKKAEPSGKFVQSPMVGTFYRAASPSDPAFIQPGDKISENTVVCIIEAMKVMNEIKAGVSGIVKEVLVENGHPVEFGTKLFRVE